MPLFIGHIDTMWDLFAGLDKTKPHAIFTRPRFPARAVVAWGRVYKKWGKGLSSWGKVAR